MIQTLIYFRISPEKAKNNDDAIVGQKRGKSAPEKKILTIGKESEGDGQVSPPDPLEPWSTKDLANINKLLDTDDN